MRLSKWLALLLALCLLISALPVAVAEEVELDDEALNLVEVGDDLPMDGLDLGLDLGELPLDIEPIELPPVEEETVSDPEEPTDEAEEGLVENNSNYTELSNSTAFTMNGVTIRAGDESSKELHNCWKWAQAIYKKVWGCNFDSTFEGKAAKGHNLLRNLTDEERKLTPENLKYFVSHSVPGATLRVQSCPSSCSGFNTDGCGKHEKHSLIIAEIREDGLVTMDDQGNVHTRFYTWEGFCNSWKRWVYVKYIKWPNAPALFSTESLDGYGVTKVKETYRVRATAKSGVGIFSLPEEGKMLATLRYPATFTADCVTLKKFEGYSWAHGKSSTGVTGWLPLTEFVAGPNTVIPVTDIALDHTSILIAKGGSFTLKAAVAPVDASDQMVTWSSSDTDVVTVSGGVVTGVGSGTATVTATASDGTIKATCSVKVSDAQSAKELTRTGSNGTVKLPVGSKLQLIPTFATAKGWKIKSVSSSKSKYASVSKAGVVTAKKKGTTTITVKCKNGKKATLKVQVVKAGSTTGGGTIGGDIGGGSTETPVSVQPTAIYLSKTGTVNLKVGYTLQLYTKLVPSTAVTTLTWASSDPKIAYVDDTGLVYGLKKGTCKIGVKTSNGVYAIVTVKVG